MTSLQDPYITLIPLLFGGHFHFSWKPWRGGYSGYHWISRNISPNEPHTCIQLSTHSPIIFVGFVLFIHRPKKTPCEKFKFLTAISYVLQMSHICVVRVNTTEVLHKGMVHNVQIWKTNRNHEYHKAEDTNEHWQVHESIAYAKKYRLWKRRLTCNDYCGLYQCHPSQSLFSYC